MNFCVNKLKIDTFNLNNISEIAVDIHI